MTTAVDAPRRRGHRNRLGLAGVVIAGLVIAGQTVAYLMAPRLTGEGTVPDWLSVAALALTTLAAARLTSTTRSAAFAVLSLALAFLAFDDAVGLHERIAAAARPLGIPGGGDVLFLLPYLPLLAFVLAALWVAGSRSGRAARRAIRAGLVLLATSVAIRLAGAAALAAGAAVDEWERRAAAAAMHDAELAAWILLAAGLATAQTVRTSARTPRAASD